jgi:hypothetical protein
MWRRGSCCGALPLVCCVLGLLGGVADGRRSRQPHKRQAAGRLEDPAEMLTLADAQLRADNARLAQELAIARAQCPGPVDARRKAAHGFDQPKRQVATAQTPWQPGGGGGGALAHDDETLGMTVEERVASVSGYAWD